MGEYGESIKIASPFFRRTKDDAVILGQALEMRLDTRKGTFWDAPGYGLAVDEYLNEGITSDGIEGIRAAIKAECEQDERVASAAVTCEPEQTPEGWSLTPDIRIFPVTGEPFTLTGPIYTFTGSAIRKGF